MPDITMCGNPDRCPKAGTCYRAIAEPSMMQCYMDFYESGDGCEDYIPCRDEGMPP